MGGGHRINVPENQNLFRFQDYFRRRLTPGYPAEKTIFHCFYLPNYLAFRHKKKKSFSENQLFSSSSSRGWPISGSLSTLIIRAETNIPLAKDPFSFTRRYRPERPSQQPGAVSSSNKTSSVLPKSIRR